MHMYPLGGAGDAKVRVRMGDPRTPAIAQRLASRDPEKAGAVCERFAIPHQHRHYESLLASTEIDPVSVPLPNTLHGEWMQTGALDSRHIRNRAL